MDDEEICSSQRSSKKLKKMENTPKPNNGSKVKLKVVKKKVNIRRPNGLNRSNSSFNSSLNASMRMKQTLTTNNRALAQALQITKQDLALATDLIASLKKENKDLMMEKAETNHIISQGIDGQVNEKLKPLLLMFRVKIREVSNRLVDVALAMKDLSSAVSSQLGSISNTNSRVNSLESYQDLSTFESTKTPTNETVVSPKRRSNAQTFNDLSLIAESSFLNLEQVQNSIDVLDMVLENESEKSKDASDIIPANANKPPQRVLVETRRSRSRRGSMSRRQSMDEIDFGSNVVKNRKSRRSSFFVSATGLEKTLRPSLGSAMKDDESDSNPENQDNDNNKMETELLSSPVVPEDDTTILLTDPPVTTAAMEVDEVCPDINEDLQPELLATTQLNSPAQISQSPAQQQQQQQQEDLVPVVPDDSLVTTKIASPTPAEEINYTVVNEVDMELTDVINSSVQLNVEASSSEPDAQSAKKTEDPVSAEPGDTKSSSQNEEPVFVKPCKVPKMKKEGKKQMKKTKEKAQETSVEDESKTVVELRLPKPGKIIFSAMRKNIAGVRPSPPKSRSKKKLAEMKKDELTAEPKNLFDFHDKTPQMFAKKPESAETGIYDVSLNDSVYGTCQSLGEYRERVAMTKRFSSANTNELPSSSTSSTDAAQTEVGEGKREAALEILPDAGIKPVEEKKRRTRSKKAANGNEKKKRCRSKKRVDDSDSDSDGDKTYVKHYQKTVKSDDMVVPERETTRRARSKVISYKEEESDFDLTLIEKKTPIILKNPEAKQKVADSSSSAKEKEVEKEIAPNVENFESKNVTKKETGRKSLKGTDEKRTRSRKKSAAEIKTKDHSDDPVSERAETLSPEKSDKVSKSTTLTELQDLISRLDKLQKKRSDSHPRSATKPEDEAQNPAEVVSKPKSTSGDIFQRYKEALGLSSDPNHKDELKNKECAKSRSRPARNESSDKTTVQNQYGRSRSLRVQKSYNSMDDKVGSTPEKKRSRSVAKREEKAVEHFSPSSPLKKREESPEVGRKSKNERGRSKSRARSKGKILGTRSLSTENNPDESPNILQRKIRKERGRSRSKAAVAKTTDAAVINNISDDVETANSEVNLNRRRTVRSRSTAGRELLSKLKASNAEDENEGAKDSNVQNVNMDATRKSTESDVPESLLKKPKSSFGNSNQNSDTLKTSTNVQINVTTVSPKRSLENSHGKRSSEYTNDENQDLKRPRRGTKPMSYKEPSISKKLRQGDKLFAKVQVGKISPSHGNLFKIVDGEFQKRSILQNVTNINC